MVSASRTAIAGAIIRTRRWRSTHRSQPEPNSARAGRVSGTCVATSGPHAVVDGEAPAAHGRERAATRPWSGAGKPRSVHLADGPDLFETSDLLNGGLGVLQRLFRRDRAGNSLRQLDAERILDFWPLRVTRARGREIDRLHQRREVTELR